jgi:cell division protein FtsQ
VRAADGFRLSPRWIVGLTAVALAGAAAIVLATGGRAEKLADAARGAAIDRSAALGFRLANVHLQGASAEAAADILKAAALHRDTPVFGLDLAAIRGRVEHVGWVKSARVIRLLPDTVVIAVDQRRLVAVWQHAGRSAVIDSDGVAAPEADPIQFSGLPLVVGEGANTAAAAILPAVLSRPRLAERLEALVRVDDRRWDLRLKDGSIIQLPATDEEAALIRLDQLDQKARILELGFSKIDLRDPEMVAVRPRGAPAVGMGTDGAG